MSGAVHAVSGTIGALFDPASIEWPDTFTLTPTTPVLTVTGPDLWTLAATTPRRELDSDRDPLTLAATTPRLTLED
jgi:hypothetical protein